MATRNLDRRRFLQRAVGGAVAGMALGTREAPAKLPTVQTDVLILGAGMAGITAGAWLRTFGIRSLVLEARDRLGGRIWTSRRWPDAPLDLGAAFIHDSPHSPITPLAQFFHVHPQGTYDTDFFNFTMSQPDGTPVSDDEVAYALLLYGGMSLEVKASAAWFQALGAPDQPLGNVVDQVLADATQGLQLTPLDLQVVQVVIDLNIRGHGAELSDQSLYFWDQDQNVVANHDLALRKGYVQLVEGLAAYQQVLYGQVVQQIYYGPLGVTVVTNQGVFTARYALVTLPLGVLQSGLVQFLPPLPAWKQAAINRLHMGLFDKLVLRFPRAFWDAQRNFFYRTSPQVGQFKVWFNTVPLTCQPILVAFVFADFAQQLEGLGDAQVVGLMMQVLRQWYGPQVGDIPNPVDFQRTRWAADPFARGSYSHIPPGASGVDYDVMAQPVGRLLFAGEATHRTHPQSVWGAYESGLREAYRLWLLRSPGTSSLAKTGPPVSGSTPPWAALTPRRWASLPGSGGVQRR